ncbi:hypothetical protein KSS87_006438 [Heliosperma pusillum]|nr:hypothetical protein KSS87_006438 [Heliosperma pusillum]
MQSNQHFKSASAGQFSALPGVFFFYDLSPIKVSSFPRAKFTSLLPTFVYI